MQTDALAISVTNLTKQFGQAEPRGLLRPGCRSISLQVPTGSTVGIVGESGSGKTTLARCIAGLLTPDSGRIEVHGRDVAAMTAKERREFRRAVQFVFQNPDSALNPRMTVRRFVAEAFRNFAHVPPRDFERRLVELATLVGLDAGLLDRYPHALSGGQKQRVGIMRALACDPGVVVLDEPTSALDVSVQAQVLATLRDIQVRTSVSFILISHDVGVIRYMCERVVVMYLGRIVEQGSTDAVFGNPLHPYTRALIAAVPRPIGRHPPAYESLEATRLRLPKEDECPLRPRCPKAVERCVNLPEMETVAANHSVACWTATRQPIEGVC